MSEEENVSVEGETLQGDAQATDSVLDHNDVSSEEQENQQSKRNDSDHNWSEMRRQMREKDQRIDDLSRQFLEISKRNPPTEEVDELANLAEDDILTVAQAKKLAQKMARGVAEDVFKEREAATVDERVQLKYSDYADIVTKENRELLKQTEPELAQSLYHIPDPYNQAVTAYKLLKKVTAPGESSLSLDKKRALENSQKPLSVNAVTKQSAIGNAHLFENGLTPDLKKQLWADMKQAMKG